MTAPHPCPVDGCTGTAHPAFVIARVGPRERVPVALCPSCWHRTGEGREPVAVEYRPPIGRWQALVRVTIGEPRRIRQRASTPIPNRRAPG